MNDVQIVPSQMPVKQAEKADLRVVSPVYVWKTGKTFFLSKKEKIVADTFLATRSYAECWRALKKEGFEKSWMTCKRWLERPHMKGYLMERFEEMGVSAGWDEAHWLMVMTRHLQGHERLQSGDLYAMKLIADMKGFGEKGIMNQSNVQINFHERAG